MQIIPNKLWLLNFFLNFHHKSMDEEWSKVFHNFVFLLLWPIFIRKGSMKFLKILIWKLDTFWIQCKVYREHCLSILIFYNPLIILQDVWFVLHWTFHLNKDNFTFRIEQIDLIQKSFITLIHIFKHLIQGLNTLLRIQATSIATFKVISELKNSLIRWFLVAWCDNFIKQFLFLFILIIPLVF